MSLRRLSVALALGGAVLGLSAGGRGQDAAKGEAPKEETFTTVDGVELRGVFYRASNPKQSPAATPVVMVLHSFKGPPYLPPKNAAAAKAEFAKEEEAWDSACKAIQAKGWHAFRFDFRGHGKSTRITAQEFYDPAKPWGSLNKSNTRLPKDVTTATQTTLDVSDFKPDYYPMLVQDIAAARAHLDKKNDSGEVNTSSLYLLGANDAVNLGLFWIATEWNRERIWNQFYVTTLGEANYVFPRRPKPPGDDAAGQDIRGAIWLSPANSPGNAIPRNALTNIVLSEAALRMRVETQMAFLYGAKDTQSAAVTKALCDNVLKVIPKDAFNPPKPGAKEPKIVGPNGKQIPNPERTFYGAIKDTRLTGTGLLGNNLGTEALIEDFILDVEKLRRSRDPIKREWQKPLYIDIRSYGLAR